MKLTTAQVRSFINRVNLKIIEKGMTKTEFYKQSGVSSALFSQWNTGTNTPTEKSISKVAAALGVSAEYLLTGEEQQKKPAPEVGDELNSGYYDLTPDNRALIDAMIERLIKSQSDD